ncbi:MAG TPA: metal-dependent hydrolase [Labilithrix sp.]|nr:metal-dependent hydrolase [Labilithrix sp.]
MNQASTAASSARTKVPTPRTPHVAFAGVPKKWFGGSTAATQVANGVNLLFPAGERFFVRAVRHYLPELEDAALAARVRGFFGQEGRHAQAHERFFETLKEQGYDIDAILVPYEALAYGKIEKATSPALRLAVTVALEHFTAILAEDALSSGTLDHAHPALRQLLEWHAVEELEHKSVAFDVLAAVRPSYPLRITGLALATVVLGGFWIQATRALLAQDGMSLRDCAREMKALRKAAQTAGDGRVFRPIFTRVFLKGILEYLRPGFHPADKDHERLVTETLARLTAEGVVDGVAGAPA